MGWTINIIGSLDAFAGGFKPTIYAIPPFLVGIIAAILGLLSLIYERGSRLGALYCIATLSGAVWLIGYGLAYSSTTLEQAAFFIRISHAGVAIIPPALYNFTVTLLQLRGPFRRLVAPIWMLFLGMAGAALSSSAFLEAPLDYFWGYYGNYRWLGVIFIVCLVTTLTTTVYLLWREQHDSLIAHTDRKRTRLVLIGFVVGFTAIVDSAPALGIPIYPFGYAPVLFLIATIAYTNWRHRLLPVNLELAASQIVETISDILVVLDRDGVVRVANSSARELLSPTVGPLEGRMFGSILPTLDFEEHRRALEIKTVYEAGEVELQLDGRTQFFTVCVSRRRDSARQPLTYVYLLKNVTEQVHARLHLDRLAHHDDLTGLPNRALLLKRLKQSVAYAKRHRTRAALLFIGLDGFKAVNDSLGHHVGDRVLVEVAKRLRQCVRAEDTVARLGGDEFMMILEGLGDVSDAGFAARKILDSISCPYRIEGYQLMLTGSIGISIIPDDSDDLSNLLKNADIAMYRAKEAGCDGYEYFAERMHQDELGRFTMKSDLRVAYERGEFFIHYQPKQRLSDRRIVGAEALLRWESRGRPRATPDIFIPCLEEMGLLIQVGDWVIESAALQAKHWLDDGHPVRVSVNVSARQVRHGSLAESVGRALQQAGLPAWLLELEITESILMQDMAASSRVLNELRNMGVAISLDDFGTGYSSLAYLKRLPIDVVKIDKSFVRDLVADAEDAAIGRAIIGMSHSLRIAVIAEGVETLQQVEWLEREGCDEIQGYWLARPMPAADMGAWLERNAATYFPGQPSEELTGEVKPQTVELPPPRIPERAEAHQRCKDA